MFSRFKQEACEIQCRLCLGRIKLMRNKRTLQLQQSRKEVANLLKTGKQEYARIRVEGVIREQLMLQAYEILELYMELLSVRAQLISKTKEIPRDMVEAISSIIYAAQRVGDLPELTKLRKMFEVKYGQQYVQEANNDATSSKWQVNNNLIRCLLVEPPEAEDKLANLSEIAQEHGVEWDLSAAARELLPPPPPVPTPPNFDDGTPVPGYPNTYGAGHGGMPPAGTAQGQYTDANQAAAAAAYAATQARAAADYAAQFVMHQAGLSAPAAGAAVSPSSDAVSDAAQFAVQQAGLAAPDGPPPSWYVPAEQAPAIHRPQGPHSYPGTDPHGGTPGQNGGGPEFANGGAAGQQTVNYQPGVARSDEDIQRAYDEALGAPAKFGSSASAPMPPSPPPAVPDLPPPPPLSHVPPPTNTNSLNLPAPPKAGVQPGAPNQPEDEYEALTRRLEALKRS